VCVVTAGPGATNSVSAVAHAFSTNAPLVHITGSLPPGAAKEAMHGLDEPGFLVDVFRPVSKWSVRVERVEDLSGLLRRAFSLARSVRPGPVHLEIPLACLNADTGVLPSYHCEPVLSTLKSEEDAARTGRGVDQILRVATAAMIYAGRGVENERLGAELVAAAEAAELPVVTHANSMGVVPTNSPCWAGYLDSWGVPAVTRDAISSAELMVAVGIRPGTEEATILERRGPDRIIALTDEPLEESCEGSRIEFQRGTVAQVLEVLRRQVPAPPERNRFWTEHGRRAQAFRQRLHDVADSLDEERPLHPAYVARVLGEVLPPDAMLVLDSTDSFRWFSLLVPVRWSGAFVQFGAYGSMGLDLPAGLAAAMAGPEAPVVVVTGDGGFLMACNDFGTAVVEGASLVVIVLNNHAHGMIERIHRLSYHRSSGASLGVPCFGEWARSYGVSSMRVEHPRFTRGVLERAFEMCVGQRRPVMVEVETRIDFSQPPDDLIPFDFEAAK